MTTPRPIALALVALLAACGTSKKKSSERDSDRIETRGGISVIPRGKVVHATAKGEQFFLEVEAPVSIDQAVSFYRSQLPRDRWQEIRIAQVSPETWGIQATRGMFDLTGRIKRLDAERVSIAFERAVRASATGWIPPVAREVTTLPDAIRWEDRVFESTGTKVELRGRSRLGADALRVKLEADLRAAGWTVEALPPNRLKAYRKGQKPPRVLVYRLEALPQGVQVGLTLGLVELLDAKGPARAAPPPPRPEAKTAENLIPVPPDLVLWKSETPPVAQQESEGLLTVSFDRPCKTSEELVKEVEKRLRERGFKLLPKTEVPGGASDLAPASVTASKGKRLVVAIVNREMTFCSVNLMVTEK